MLPTNPPTNPNIFCEMLIDIKLKVPTATHNDILVMNQWILNHQPQRLKLPTNMEDIGNIPDYRCSLNLAFSKYSYWFTSRIHWWKRALFLSTLIWTSTFFFHARNKKIGLHPSSATINAWILLITSKSSSVFDFLHPLVKLYKSTLSFHVDKLIYSSYLAISFN